MDRIEHHLEKLVIFVSVVDTGSIRSYALSRKISQPGVSQCISSLEKALKLKLLERSRTGISLTREGKILYRLGQRLIESSQLTSSELIAESKRETEIKLGTYDSVAIYFIPKLIQKMREHFPYLSIKLTCDRSANILKLLESGLIDCGLCVGSSEPKRLKRTPIYSDFYSFYKSSQCIESKNIILVGDAQDETGKDVRQSVSEISTSPIHRIEVPSFEIVKAMAMSGLGIGVLPTRVANHAETSNIDGGLRQTFYGEKPIQLFGRHTFYFYTRRRAPATPEITHLFRAIQIIEKESSISS